MLIYNYQKEFLGIDESDLKALGFSNLSELRRESANFADLFVKTPGFVHNFKHVHWIDFVTCAEGSEDSKVIIHANGKNFRAVLDIKIAYLVDNPTQKAFLINLMSLRALTHKENEQVAGDILEKPATRTSTQTTAIFNTPDFKDDKQENFEEEVKEVQEIEITDDPYEISTIEALYELDTSPKIIEDIYEDAPIDLGDDLLNIDEGEVNFDEPNDTDLQQQEEEVVSPYLEVAHTSLDYVYNPHLASDELGLPVDLIEEFIQDFVSQAEEFKDELYTSLHDAKIDNVKILSHKLKGVAANLRIEDAFEVLSTINTSNDTDEIKSNMDIFYSIVSKLAGKEVKIPEIMNIIEEVQEVKETEKEIPNTIEDDDLVLSFKDDTEDSELQEIESIEVPKKIEMPELADDYFVSEDDMKEELEIQEISLNKDEVQTIENLEKEHIVPPSQSTFSKSLAAAEIGIDDESFDSLFQDYLIEGNNTCHQINEAIEKNNPQEWAQTAIRLKGMSDNMRINDFTKELETIINTQNYNVAKENLNSIDTKLKKISRVEV
ncbi:MAG: HPt (histidine-containing phosphotransfer) domain-containing protein [Sulfurimonas sp.]|jgi:HPt (histidine-containing phosphotransfer) domain-containing protein